MMLASRRRLTDCWCVCSVFDDADSLSHKRFYVFQGHLPSSEKIRVFNPVHDLLRARLKQAAGKYTTRQDITMWVGTYNLNGKPPGSENLLPWLFPVPGACDAMALRVAELISGSPVRS